MNDEYVKILTVQFLEITNLVGMPALEPVKSDDLFEEYKKWKAAEEEEKKELELEEEEEKKKEKLIIKTESRIRSAPSLYYKQ